MNTDKFALSSSGWPFNQFARQPVPPQRMGKGGSFLSHHNLRDGGGDVRSVFICVYLWLKPGSSSSRFGLFRPVSTKKN
jgi:hypothetical protein